MEFKEFASVMARNFSSQIKGQNALFVTEVDKDNLWELYLDSFPEGANEVFRERREFDCGCCRHFVKQFGNVVTIENDKLRSIWRFEVDDPKYQTVVTALADFVESVPIRDVFVTTEKGFGTGASHEQMENYIHTWNHFRIDLPKNLIYSGHSTVNSVMAEYRDIKHVLKRSLEEISVGAVETVLDLIAEKSLYKGDEWREALEKFLSLQKEYDQSDIFCWKQSVEVGVTVGKIRNHSIGVLLQDITSRVDFEEAVRRYEKVVAPINYKRPKAIFTKAMVEQAQKTVEELGFLDSLGRRHARLSDITVNNVLWVNRNAVPYMSEGTGVFELLKQEATENPKRFDNIPGVSIEDFVRDILPTTTSLEVLFENKHQPNLMTIIAPQTKDSKTMFKWGNNFSWSYNGNITDSMKERVKAMGGKVEGVLRATLQWENNNDFDLHCKEPDGNHIYFQSKGGVHPSSGMLDVDIIEPYSDHRVVDGVAVENIIYSNKSKMQEGIYEIFIHNYNHRGGITGFQAEIEYEGQVYSYEYPHELQHNENVLVAKFRFSKSKGIEFIQSLPSTFASKTIWNITTNQFQPVTAFMFSPNFWDDQVGHKHYFFIVNGCRTEDRPNGFYNEFLTEDLLKHKRVFEALGSKMKVELLYEQLSGLGFSSTKRDSLICKVDNKIIKVVF